MHGHQRGGASSLNGKTGAFEVERIRDPRRQKIFLVANHRLIVIRCADEVAVELWMDRRIGAHPYPRVYADSALILVRVIAGAFKRLPCALQEQTMLWVGDVGLARVHAEKRGVEQLN